MFRFLKLKLPEDTGGENVFENIEKAIRDCYRIVIEEERYGSGLLIGLDYQMNPYYTLIADLIDRATSPGDTDAMEAFFALKEFSENHPEFLFAHAETLEQGLLMLDKKVVLWNQLERSMIEKLLDEINVFRTDDI